jgi:hypothetical protein
MEQYIPKNKYSKSNSGLQCVGPCYKKNTKIIHPIYLNVVTDNQNSFCPTAEWINKDNDGKETKYYIDKCTNITNIKESEHITSYDLLYPFVDFDEHTFLVRFYNINKFNDAIQWIEDNKHTPINSRQRIFDLGLDAFGSTFDIMEIGDTRTVDFLLQLIKLKYLNKFVMALMKYININQKKDIVKLYDDKNYNEESETDESIIIKTNYINKNILTFENLSNFILSYFRKEYKEQRINSPSEIMINKFLTYTNDNIKKTL